MSPAFGRPSAHDRALDLAAVRVDVPLAGGDAAWLDAHLSDCAACREVAAAFESDRQLFAPLREASPVPPRDLWARTAAAIDAEAGRARRPAGGRIRRPAALVPFVGLAAAAVVASSVLLNGATLVPTPTGPAATAMALQPGQVAVITRGPDGGLELVMAGVGEVCPLNADSCGAEAPSFESAPLAAFNETDNVDAILSPDRDRVVVIQRDAQGSDGIYVVPVRSAGSPAHTPSPAPTDETPSEVATASADASASPSTTPSDEPSPTPGDDPSASPSEPPPSESAAPSDAPVTASPEPTDEPSPDPTPDPTPDPSPTVEVTPGPDGAIQIASDVVVVGPVGAYNAGGTRFAFTARPADGSAGPDVYVWDTDEARASAVTTDHRSVFAGWDGGDLLVSRVVDGEPVSVVVEPRTGEVREELGAAWLPTVSPDGSSAVWWDGGVELAADGVTWVPDKGRLVVGAWPDGVAADEVQVLDRGTIEAWEAQWAPDGRALAAWTAGPDGEGLGRLGLYRLEAGGDKARLASPLIDDEAAFGGFSLDSSQLVYAAPDEAGERALWVVAWDEEGVGRVRLPGDATVIR